MSFEQPQILASFGTVAAVWVFTVVGVLSFLGARKMLRGPRGRSFTHTAVGAVLTLLCICSVMVVVAWLVSHHV